MTLGKEIKFSILLLSIVQSPWDAVGKLAGLFVVVLLLLRWFIYTHCSKHSIKPLVEKSVSGTALQCVKVGLYFLSFSGFPGKCTGKMEQSIKTHRSGYPAIVQKSLKLCKVALFWFQVSVASYFHHKATSFFKRQEITGLSVKALCSGALCNIISFLDIPFPFSALIESLAATDVFSYISIYSECCYVGQNWLMQMFYVPLTPKHILWQLCLVFGEVFAIIDTVVAWKRFVPSRQRE